MLFFILFMINLIPNKEQKEIVRGFYYRLVVLFLMLVGTSFLVIFGAILPSYFLSSVEVNLVNVKLETQAKMPVPAPQEQTLLAIKDLNNKLTLIEKAENNKFIVSQKVISAIILKKLPGIKITDISYENNSGSGTPLGRKVSIQGIAPSREVLLLFRQALEDDVAFKSVDLPISNFIKGSNIQFYLSLIPRPSDVSTGQAS